MSTKSGQSNKVTVWFFFLWIILSQYNILPNVDFPLGTFMGLVVTSLYLLRGARINLIQSLLAYLYFIGIHTFVFTIFDIYSIRDSVALKNYVLMVSQFTVFSFFYTTLRIDKYFWKIYKCVVILLSVIAMVQFIQVLSGGSRFDGIVPFLRPLVGEYWMHVKTHLEAVRINSLFSEPSAFAIFLVPYFYHLLHTGKQFRAFLVLAIIAISTSLTGIVFSIIGWIYAAHNSWRYYRGVNKLLTVVVAGTMIALTIYILSFGNPVSFFKRTDVLGFTSIISSRFSSYANNLLYNERLGKGFVSMFYQDALQAVFGSGLTNVANTFTNKGIYIPQLLKIYGEYREFYSAFSYQFLAYGLVGGALFLYMIVDIGKRSRSKLFFSYFVLLMLVSQAFCNTYFFLMLLHSLLYPEDSNLSRSAKKKALTNRLFLSKA